MVTSVAVMPAGRAGNAVLPQLAPTSLLEDGAALVEADALVADAVLADRTPLPPCDGTLMDGRFTRPLPSLTCVLAVVPSANVYPSLSVVVTERPAVGVPPTVTVRYAPVMVLQAVPE
ncbi:MAG: hypothetical protein ABS60_08430 [Microbacterium sp. SCN 71-17]|nr:MAG: hypothetical protein ABS60_08430 [Microbacterium sp. SCN 71-17]